MILGMDKLVIKIEQPCVGEHDHVGEERLMLHDTEEHVALGVLTHHEVHEKGDHISVAEAVTDTTSPVQDSFVLVETSRGLFLSMADGVRGIYNNVTTAADLQGGQLITTNLPAALLSQIQTVGGLVEGNTVFETYGDGGVVSIGTQPLDNHDTSVCNTDMQLSVPDTNTETTEPKKKRGGGWPKGKKRKNVPEVNAPRKPATGYVLFAIEKRQEVKAQNPNLSFSDITKCLGQNWSNLSPEEKQVYLDKAEEDKKRYIEDMKKFQQSETYQSFLKKKKQELAENGGSLEDDTFDTLIDLEENEGANELFCKVCNQYFISVHNKKEHMFGQQHLQNITGELQKEIERQTVEQQQQAMKAASLDGSQLSGISGSPSEQTRDRCNVDVEAFMHGFLQRNLDRELEIRQLQKCMKEASEENIAMCKQVKELEEYESKLEQDVGSARAYAASLTAQIDTLKMVPTLFGVINF
ncbi:hypothetical protein CHS0354_017689 [Potamilus streckersoni]|uniref:HMG box domain-containing protein n=1 Tax=Potamilus streckersoni TaxID=2493646 RepID=A0AAE0VRY3_9BIVA|nr:hypothetical protein CHS0354_017689 [Potamilus streckersoni]